MSDVFDANASVNYSKIDFLFIVLRLATIAELLQEESSDLEAFIFSSI